MNPVADFRCHVNKLSSVTNKCSKVQIDAGLGWTTVCPSIKQHCGDTH